MYFTAFDRSKCKASCTAPASEHASYSRYSLRTEACRNYRPHPIIIVIVIIIFVVVVIIIITIINFAQNSSRNKK